MRKLNQHDEKWYQQQQRPPNDLSRCPLPMEAEAVLIAVVELSLTSWLVAGIVPGVERQPLKKLKPEPDDLLTLLQRWPLEAERSGRKITRIALGYEAGR